MAARPTLVQQAAYGAEDALAEGKEAAHAKRGVEKRTQLNGSTVRRYALEGVHRDAHACHCEPIGVLHLARAVGDHLLRVALVHDADCGGAEEDLHAWWLAVDEDGVDSSAAVG